MGHYQFWLLNEADERTQGLDLPCAADHEAWLVAERLLAECRRVEIWTERELIGRLGAAPLEVMEGASFIWPAGRRRRTPAKVKPSRKPPSRQDA
ncbi:hypothetical protein [Phenylobacterium sp.]|uniref:hypothetical protein n=1 Tax=Phenylobacterium sp. TaxID=1871053 RepID=UPI00286BB450|nr:hypothetical protein [Phenylobacterium sp.]